MIFVSTVDRSGVSYSLFLFFRVSFVWIAADIWSLMMEVGWCVFVLGHGHFMIV